jgi:hypothetical protein
MTELLYSYAPAALSCLLMVICMHNSLSWTRQLNEDMWATTRAIVWALWSLPFAVILAADLIIVALHG